MKPAEFKLIMSTSRSTEACSAEIKGSNRQVSLCHFKREVSCEIGWGGVKEKKEENWQEAPSDHRLHSGLTAASLLSDGGGRRVEKETADNLCGH